MRPAAILRPRTRLLVLLALVGVAALVAGLAINAETFALGLLSSLAGFIAAAFAAVLYLDELAEQQSERRRRKKWDAVRVVTLTAIWDQLRAMTIPIVARSPSADAVAVAYEGALQLLEEVSAWIPSQAVQIDPADGLTKDETSKAEMRSLYT